MATTLENITDLLLSQISDRKLDTLYISSGSDAMLTYCEPWLLNSIRELSPICSQSLDSYSTTTQSFTIDLTTENQLMLAKLMEKYWLNRKIQDIMQMERHIQGDFKTYSEANHLKVLQELYNTKREEVSQQLLDYGYTHNSWANWKLQDF